MSIRTAILTAGLLVASVVPAQGVVLATQPASVSSSQHIFCRVVNVSNTNKQVLIQILNTGGSVLHQHNATLTPGFGSTISRMGSLSAYCRFTVKGGRASVRAGATIGTTTTDLYALPAT